MKLAEQYIIEEKSRLYQKYGCTNIDEVITVLNDKLNKRSVSL